MTQVKKPCAIWKSELPQRSGELYECPHRQVEKECGAGDQDAPPVEDSRMGRCRPRSSTTCCDQPKIRFEDNTRLFPLPQKIE